LNVFRRISEGIEKFLRKKNYTLEEITGKITKNI